MLHTLTLLSQIKNLGGDEPRLDEASSALTLAIAGISFVCILLIAFKVAKRNYAKD